MNITKNNMTWIEMLNDRINANVTISQLKKCDSNNDINVYAKFKEYTSLCKKDSSIIENAINLIKSLNGDIKLITHNDMENFIYAKISFNKLKEIVKQDTYKKLFKGFQFYLFEWALTDWRDCELSLPQLVKYYPNIAKDLFNIN